jgi:nucleoside-diphosphate-sugar epimerase
MKRVLVIGATGQIGSELTPLLRERLGDHSVIATGYKKEPSPQLLDSGPFRYLDCRDYEKTAEIVSSEKIDTIYHLAAILSATAEEDPLRAWDINMNGLINVLEAAKNYQTSLFVPSSIGAFGPTTPPELTPQDTLQHPVSIYGITKTSGELLCNYYYRKYGVDVRGVRYPGIISAATGPGGGTTDYAVDIFTGAVKEGRYRCYLREETRLDMMYMPDALKAALDLMNADPGRLTHRNAFNVTAMSVTPGEIAAEIMKHIPGFTMEYSIDPVRQEIADSWPRRLDDAAARREWGWEHEYDLKRMVREMLEKISEKLKVCEK